MIDNEADSCPKIEAHGLPDSRSVGLTECSQKIEAVNAGRAVRKMVKIINKKVDGEIEDRIFDAARARAFYEQILELETRAQRLCLELSTSGTMNSPKHFKISFSHKMSSNKKAGSKLKGLHSKAEMEWTNVDSEDDIS